MSWLKKKKTTTAFSLISLLGGIFFLNPNITGNTIANSASPNSTGIIGFLLIFCSIVLAIYSSKK